MANFNGVFIELCPRGEGTIDFRCGYSFPADTDPEMVEYFKTMVAGVFGMVSSHPDDLVAVGEIVRTVSDFDVPQAPEEDAEVVFEADEELLKKMGADKIIDLNKYKPGPGKKH